VGPGLRNRIAILRRTRAGFDRAAFFEMLTAYRGSHVGAFEDFEAALARLCGSGEPA
jgi:hypothetical protein